MAVLITGASAGIGHELAKLFAADGHELVLTARRAEQLTVLAGELRATHGVVVHVWPEDLADPAVPRRLFDRAAADGLAIDILVNNAGFGALGPFAELPIERQLAMLQVNIVAATALTHLFLGPMRRRGHGRILILSSLAAFQPGPFMAVYYATKAYDLFFGEALAEELRGSGITATVLCPGFTATEFQEAAGMTALKGLAAMRPMSAALVARIGYDGLMRGRRLVIPGWKNKLAFLAPRLLPRRLIAAAIARLQRGR